MKFTYEDKGTSIDIHYDGSEAIQTYDYTVEGNKLSLYDKAFEWSLTYTKN